jgi:hypothetical protein
MMHNVTLPCFVEAVATLLERYATSQVSQPETISLHF